MMMVLLVAVYGICHGFWKSDSDSNFVPLEVHCMLVDNKKIRIMNVLLRRLVNIVFFMQRRKKCGILILQLYSLPVFGQTSINNARELIV